jgi:hypothetical protein
MDYEVEIRVRNGRIATAMKKIGIESVAELARKTGGSRKTIYGIVNMRISPLDRYGEWLDDVLKIAEVLDCLPMDLFNEHQLNAAVEKSRIQVPMSTDQLACFLGQMRGPTTEEEIEEMVDKRLMLNRAMKYLSERESQALAMRLDNLHYEDVAQEMKISRTRAIMLLKKATYKVKTVISQMQAGKPICVPEIECYHDVYQLDIGGIWC